MEIRAANISEFEQLTNLNIKSEAHWGYDSEYMNKFKAMYSVKKEFLENNPAFVLVDDKEIVGFYGIIIHSDGKYELEYMFIDPKYIGKGYGKILWNHMINYCKKNGIYEVELITSPQAVGFYLKMGAEVIGELDCALITGRKIPKLRYEIR